MKNFIFVILAITFVVAVSTTTIPNARKTELRRRREAGPEPEPNNRPPRPISLPPINPRLPREADPEPEPGNRPVYIPPPRPPHPRLRREADPEPEPGNRPVYIPPPRPPHPSAPSSSYFKGDESKSNYGQGGSQETKSASDEDESLSGYERSKSESERVAESIEPSHCKEVQKDSMTCKVCKDPKTGSNSEQCSYKYLPSDKSYSYSKSKSFGSPTESKDKSYDGSEKKESKEPYENPGYDYSSKKMPYVTDSDIKDEFSVSDQTKQSEAKEESAKSALKKSDAGFYDAFKKKAEIQKVLQEFQKEDRSNCKKLMRDKMTCYQCIDEKGFQKEECAFVTSEEPSVDKSDYREEKEYHVEPTKKVPRSITVQHPLHDFPIEPEAAASEGAYIKREQADKEKDSGEVERSKEVEPYEFAAETKPLFDKVLGFTLPAYMLSTSEHEEEFDKIVASKGI
ncbi:serine/arginine repetitive matrix protein 1-like isoform X1 [Bombus pascuorum]|nr:serine/arginine repetitive matrix protein 1-like isoform X1 [Bombus pascuorum]